MTWPRNSPPNQERPGNIQVGLRPGVAEAPVLLPSRAYGQPVSGINKNTRHKQAARAREFRNFLISALDAAAEPPVCSAPPAGVIFVLRRVRIKRSMAG